MMIIDFHNHFYPAEYLEALEAGPSNIKITYDEDGNPLLHYPGDYNILVPSHRDIDHRAAVLEKVGVDKQILTFTTPGTHIETPQRSVELAKIVNNGFAKIMQEHSDHFTALATLPMNDPEAAVAEAERAIKDLRLRAVEIFSDVAGKPLDAPEFMPVYEKMAELGRPIFIHPRGEMSTPDYEGEKISKYRLWTKVRWPYATTMAVCRLVYSGVLERLPGLKLVTHHCGGLIPYLVGRLDWADDVNEMLMGQRDIDLKEHALVYFRRIFYDTAVSGNIGRFSAPGISPAWIKWSLARTCPLEISSAGGSSARPLRRWKAWD